MSLPATNPTKEAPPSSVVNTNTSDLSAVAVSSGAVPPGHWTEAGHVTVKPLPLTSCLTFRLKPEEPVAGASAKLIVVFSERTNEKLPPVLNETDGVAPVRTV
jgi:hypothetical protein